MEADEIKEIESKENEPTISESREDESRKTENIQKEVSGPETIDSKKYNPKRKKHLNQSSNHKISQTCISVSSKSPSLDYKNIVLWRHPGLTIFYCGKELFFHTKEVILKLMQCRKITYFIIVSLVVFLYLNFYCVSTHPVLLRAQQKLLWGLYWFSLGLLSSVGLGTGVHTFALYLGPYIASVTVAANECGYLDFEEYSSLGSMECPEDPDPRWAATMWNIMCKVRLESYMWGLGTAVGELPPYFMGRAARVSGEDRDALREVEALDRRKEGSPESLTCLDRAKLCVRDLVVKAGFWGILACASIPNPFFDLAGITCGSFLVPFWIFFGATVIGKAVIKTTIQQVFVILSFNKYFLTWMFGIVSRVPLVGHRLGTYLAEYIAKQREKFGRDRAEEKAAASWFSIAYHCFVICAFMHCFVSIINSLAQNHYKRLKRRADDKGK